MYEIIAPGKLVLTGAYAVLEGGVATVIAVDRYATTTGVERTDRLSPEFRAAFPSGKGPVVDTSMLRENGEKLGLGSSAAAVVAAIASEELEKGRDLEDSTVRSGIFQRAYRAHREAQGGGSGLDIAASTYGGLLRYSLLSANPNMLSLTFPDDLHWCVIAAGKPSSTKGMLRAIGAFRDSFPSRYDALMSALVTASFSAAEMFESGSTREVIERTSQFFDRLYELSEHAEVAIFTEEYRLLDNVARKEGGVFFPSGAGGGDIGVYFGPHPPSAAFFERVASFQMKRVDLALDLGGVRVRPLVAPIVS